MQDSGPATADPYAHLGLSADERAALDLAAELSVRVGRERSAAHGLGEQLRSMSRTPDPTLVVELPELRVHVRHERSGTVVCRPEGELDAANAAQLDQVLRDVEPTGGQLVLDCADVPLVDSAALSTLLRARRRLAAGGGRLVMVHLSPAVERVLAVTGLTATLGAAAG